MNPSQSLEYNYHKLVSDIGLHLHLSRGQKSLNFGTSGACILDENLSTYLKNRGDIDELALSCSEIKGSSLVHLKEKVSLLFLDLSFSKQLQARYIPHLYDLSENLLSLDLSKVDSLQDTHVVTLLDRKKVLTSFITYGCSSLGDKSASAMLSHEFLVHINVIGCKKISTELRALVHEEMIRRLKHCTSKLP